MHITARGRDVFHLGRGWLKRARAPDAPPVALVLGTGRSGTHWLGHILGSHPDVAVTVERQPMFGWSRTMALDPASVPELLPQLVGRYRRYQCSFAPRTYADKSHPNIWIAEALLEALGDARFIGVLRDVHATVASMLRHRGVMRTIERWAEYPLPNRFLGVTDANRDAYAAMTLAERCAVRWRAHAGRLDELQATLKDRFLRVSYESLAADPVAELERLQRFLALARPFPTTVVKAESLEKWRSQLTPQQLASIARIVQS